MNLDWKHYTCAALLLAVLASWGSREKHFVKITETWTTERTTLTEQARKLESDKTELTQAVKRAQHTTKKTVPIVLPNGVVAYVTEETSSDLQEATSTMSRDFTSQLDTLTKSNTDLTIKLKEKTEETVKSAPRWAASLGYDFLAPAGGQIRGGLGLNIGPLTGLATAAPAAIFTGGLLDTRPQLEAILRF